MYFVVSLIHSLLLQGPEMAVKVGALKSSDPGFYRNGSTSSESLKCPTTFKLSDVVLETPTQC